MDHAELYGEVLAALKPVALAEVRGVRRIFKRERIPPNARVLDVACGIGRHIIPLARSGYHAVGCDLSPGLIDRARSWARKAHLDGSRVHFYTGDYRALDRVLRRAHEGPFDAAISVFTSMGYYGDKGDLATLRAVRRVVSPGGLLIVEMNNRDWVLRQFEPTGVSRVAKDLEIRELRRIDWEHSVTKSQWTFYRVTGHKKRKILEQEIVVRLYSLHELRSLFERSGWEYVASYGSLRVLEPVSCNSRRLVVVGRNPT